MSRYFISILFLLGFLAVQSQSKPIDTQPKDTVIYKQKYGLRVGIDLSRPITSFFNEDYTGLEFMGDYRLTQKLYLAAELGNEKKTRQEELGNVGDVDKGELYNFTTSGSYLKVGVDYNTYANWYGEQNSIFIGGRYAISSFNQTVNNYNIFDTNRYWSPDGFVVGSTTSQEFSGRSKSWLEMVVGVKAELFANLYLGGSVRLGFLVSNPKDDVFPNLFIPGFNKVTDGSRFGVGYNYSLTYFIPFYKKTKKPKKKEQELEIEE